MNSSLSDLMSYYCSWAKKNSGFKESIGDHFFGLILYYREYFAFSYTIGNGARICCGTLEGYLLTNFTFSATHIQEHSLTEN